MSQHRKGFFGQVRSPHHAELSLLLLSIIVTIVIEILEKSQRNPREIREKSYRKSQRKPREILEKSQRKSQRNPREILEKSQIDPRKSQKNPREILEESQRNLGSLCNVKIKMSLVPGGYLSVPGVYLQVPGGYLWFLVCMSWFMAVICRFLVVICGSWWLSCTGCPIELFWTAKKKRKMFIPPHRLGRHRCRLTEV